MKIRKTIACLLLLVMILAGCGKLNTVEAIALSNTPLYDNIASSSSESLSCDEPIYASVAVIESPKGMAYTGRWLLNGVEIDRTTQTTAQDQTDVLVFALAPTKLIDGTLRFELWSHDTLLETCELNVE